jgi:hypothetical protein
MQMNNETIFIGATDGFKSGGKMHATTSYQMPIHDYVPSNAITKKLLIELMETKIQGKRLIQP